MSQLPAPSSPSSLPQLHTPSPPLGNEYNEYDDDDVAEISTAIGTPSRSFGSSSSSSSSTEVDDTGRVTTSTLREAPSLADRQGHTKPYDSSYVDGGPRDQTGRVEVEYDDAEDDSILVDDDFTAAEMSSWSGQPHIKGGSEAMRMILLTFNALGITFTWGIEMTYCTPYLLNLGLTKSNTALVWIAGPLSGLIVQPIIGVIADESKSRWGRRRPFVVVGSIIVAISLLVLGFTQEIVGFFVSEKETARRLTIVLAVLSIYFVDFAINAVMSCARSLVVDTLPIEKQQTGAAWGSRMGAIGHMLGYGAGAIDLVGIFGTRLGDTQFKQLTVISTFLMLFSSGVTCWAVQERVLVSTRHDSPRKGGGGGDRLKVFRQIWSTMLHLPPRLQAICWIQFWAWIGWFPFLFYSTTWIGETYFRYDAPAATKAPKDALGEIGRIGSFALVIYSCITFLGAWLIPVMVKSPDDDVFTARPPESMAPCLDTLNKNKPDLMTAWIYSHLLFASAMFLAPFAHSFRFATFLVAFCGLPWTISGWAPTTFMGVEVNRLGGAREGGGGSYRRLSHDTSIELPNLDHHDQPLHLEHGSDDGGQPATSSTGELSGIYFGILNIYTTIPQFIGTFISTIVFAILEPGKSPELSGHSGEAKLPNRDGPNAIAVCLFIGAICAVVASHMTRRLKRLY